jgi:hypothetical protein
MPGGRITAPLRTPHAQVIYVGNQPTSRPDLYEFSLVTWRTGSLVLALQILWKTMSAVIGGLRAY